MDESELRRRLYVDDYEQWARQCSRKYFSDRRLEVRTVENGIILPARPVDEKDQYHCRGGVCDADLKFVAGYSNQAPDRKNGVYCIDEAYEVERKDIVSSNETVIFSGIMVCHFGHFLTDCLTRMWYIVQNLELEHKVVFLMVKTSRLQELKIWVYQLLDLMGLPEDRIVILDKPTQFKSVIVPDQSARIRYDFTKEFLEPFRHVTSRIRPSNVKKLFLTRGKNLQSAMHLCNQNYFEAFFHAKGYTVVSPETLSITDQIALVSGADEVATFLGTLAHWSLFSHEGARWTMLTRVEGLASRQTLINEAVGLDWYFVDTAKNFLYAEQGGGVNLLGSTDQWRRYALEHHGVTLDPNVRVPLTVVDDYIERWCKFFGSAASNDKYVGTLEKLYSRISIMETQIKLKRPILCFELHVAQRGWLPTNVEGDIAGPLDKQYSLQAIKIRFNEPLCDVSYAVCYPSEGWTAEVSNDRTAGAAGKNKPINGLSIRLSSDRFDVCYRLHGFDGNWSDWGLNGNRLVLDQSINGVEIKLNPRGGATQ